MKFIIAYNDCCVLSRNSEDNGWHMKDLTLVEWEYFKMFGDRHDVDTKTKLLLMNEEEITD